MNTTMLFFIGLGVLCVSLGTFMCYVYTILFLRSRHAQVFKDHIKSKRIPKLDTWLYYNRIYYTIDKWNDCLKLVVKKRDNVLGKLQWRINFEQETAHRLQHRSVLRFYGAKENLQDISLFYEMVEFRLDEYLMKLVTRQPIEWDDQRSAIIVDIGSGLHALHQAKLNHCALRTSRIYLTSNLRPKIAFVGFATDEHRNGRRYWSPEVFDQQEMKCVQYTQAIDIWAFGIVIWQLYAVDATPFQSIALEDLEASINNGRRPEKPKNCPAHVYDIYRQCWTNDPCQRPNAIDIVQNLAQFF